MIFIQDIDLKTNSVSYKLKSRLDFSPAGAVLLHYQNQRSWNLQVHSVFLLLGSLIQGGREHSVEQQVPICHFVEISQTPLMSSFCSSCALPVLFLRIAEMNFDTEYTCAEHKWQYIWKWRYAAYFSVTCLKLQTVPTTELTQILYKY